MDDLLSEFDMRPRPTADRPLMGLTILVIEDSAFASEALRLMCLRSGARIRRADCIVSAHRHLQVYRPSVAIVDLGLPDGSGLDLIAEMDTLLPRVPIILGMSGAEREAAAKAAQAAGADGFLAKPLASIAAFQAEILRHLPADLHPSGPRSVDVGAVDPDPLALREDLAHAMDLLALDQPPVGYLRRFLIGVARAAEDPSLEGHALAMDGSFADRDRADLGAFLSRRIQAMPVAV